MEVILAHGSVETSTAPSYIHGIEIALTKGRKRSEDGGSKLDIIEAVINELEDNPLYNAGYGSVLNRDGYVEVDGSIMDGFTGQFAAVASVKGVRYAISLARKVMEETRHVVLAGEGATIFAKEKGFAFDNCITQEQLMSWEIARKKINNGEQHEFSLYTGVKKETDTIGCVLIDNNGQLAAGSSTGGSFFKLPGRVGDTPFIGGGIFATHSCAVVCTGKGEAFIQTLTAKFVDEQIEKGKHPAEAGREAINRLYQKTGETGGLLIVDHKGQYAAVHNCNMFPVALMIDGRITEVEPIRLHY